MIKESRLKDGVLKFGDAATGVDFACQVTNVRINSKYSDDGDPIETLCGDTKPAGTKLDGRSLAGTVVQDFDDPTGFINYCWDNDLAAVAFTFTPNVGAATVSGTVTIQVPDETYGGDVNARLTSDFEFKAFDVIRTPIAGP